MAIFRNVHVSFWEDNKVFDDFTPKDKLFMLYLLTNPHTNLSGCYEISIKQMANELGYDTNTVKLLLKRMEEEHKVIRYSKETKEILVKNWCKYNWTKSDKLKKPIIKEINNIKDKQLKEDMVSIGYRYGILKKIKNNENSNNFLINTDIDDRVSIGYQYPIDTTDSDTDYYSDTDYEEIINYYINNINIRISSIEYEKLDNWIKEFKNDSTGIIKHAIDICVMNKARKMSYLEGILRNWKNNNYETLEEIKQNEKTTSLKEKYENIEIPDYDWLNGEQPNENI